MPAKGQIALSHLQTEIADLESRLNHARSRLAVASGPNAVEPTPPHSDFDSDDNDSAYIPLPQDSVPLIPTHALLLLSDSALPLGSFAYSSGLESYLAHNKSQSRSTSSASTASFHHFLKLSIASIASTSLPYVLAGYRHPSDLETLDNDLDASTPCIVAARASIAQGRALIGVWERAFRGAYAATAYPSVPASKAIQHIEAFSDALKSSPAAADEADALGPKGHFAPLWGVVCRAMGMDARQTAYVFMLNHAKAVLSAAVRASVMGPYQAQGVLASKALQDMIAARIDREWNTPVEDAGQVVPPLDLWVGRHELLYSRIFNS